MHTTNYPHLINGLPYFGSDGPALPVDYVIKSFFPDDYIGTAIEVGAVDGILLSNTYHFELLGWRCLCIEPQPGNGYFESCKSNRQHALNYAIGSANKNDVNFNVMKVLKNGTYYPWNGVSGLQLDSKLVQTHREMGLIFEIESITVKTRRLDWIITNHFPCRKIDFVSIDVEGTEIDVLKSFNPKEYGVTLLVIENNHPTNFELMFYMQQIGYKLQHRIGVNEFYILN